MRLGSQIKLLGQEVEYDPQSVELTLAGNVGDRNGVLNGTAGFTDGAYWSFETLLTIACIKHTRVTILHSDGDSRWEIDNEKVMKPMIGSILDWCAARVNQSELGVTIGDFMKRKRGGNTRTSPNPVTKLLAPASPGVERGWECAECLTENDEEDHMCWVCNFGTKGEQMSKRRSVTNNSRPSDWSRI